MVEPIIVVGPGRSGTSCVAGILHHLGVFMGSRLIGSDATNPYGHWEDCEFVEPNEAMLTGKQRLAEWIVCMSGVIAERTSLGVRWGWKDPRTCNLLNQYLELVVNPIFIRCVRDPEEIDKSIVRSYGHLGWNLANARTLRETREAELDRYLPWYSTLSVDFRRLRTYKNDTVKDIIGFCGLDPSRAGVRVALNHIR